MERDRQGHHGVVSATVFGQQNAIQVVARFAPDIEPYDERIVRAVEAELAK